MNEHLYNLVMKIANSKYDGHFTLMKFTTNWRCMFGTPFDRHDIDNAHVGKTANEAMKNAIENEILGGNYNGIR